MTRSPDLRRNRSIADVVTSAIKPRPEAETGWVIVGETTDAPGFQNSWAWSGEPHAKPQFYMSEKDGEVRFRGHATGGLSGTVVFTLPKQYRPEKVERFNSAGTDGTRAVVEVQPDGDVLIYFSGASIQGNVNKAFAIALG